MLAVALNRKERVYVLHGLDLYEKEINNDLKDTKDDAVIAALSKRIETIGAVKERLRRY